MDYATGAPYVTMDMNPITPKIYKDVIVFSPHKFLGGVESPGVMVIKKHLYFNTKPYISGGGKDSVGSGDGDWGSESEFESFLY